MKFFVVPGHPAPVTSSPATLHPRAAAPRAPARVESALDVASLFDAHADFVHRVAQRIAGSAAVADDVVQEVFVLAHQRRGELDERVGIRTWLYRATVNVVRQRRRTDARYAAAVERSARQPMPTTGDPVVEVERLRAGLAIRSCVATLEEPMREVFVLFELEGLSGAEIAEILDIPLNTAWSRLRLARAAFREAWIAMHGAPP